MLIIKYRTGMGSQRIGITGSVLAILQVLKIMVGAVRIHFYFSYFTGESKSPCHADQMDQNNVLDVMGEDDDQPSGAQQDVPQTQPQNPGGGEYFWRKK